MRRITMFNQVSADGFFEAPGGDLGWVTQDAAIHRDSAERMPSADAMMFGRRTYEMFERAWRPKDPASAAVDPHNRHQASPAAAAFSDWINAHTKLVFSTSLKAPTWQGTRVLPALDVKTVQAIKDEDGRDIIVFGSGSIVSQLTEHGLIDEYQFVVSPVLLGRGRQMVSGLTKSRALRLVNATPFPTGVVMLRYVPVF